MCYSIGLVACGPLALIPLAGTALYLACAAAALAGCIALTLQEEEWCYYVGDACCPVGCGSDQSCSYGQGPCSSCCDNNETCADPERGLCCPPGTQPCGGANCCESNEVCVNGACISCRAGTTMCPDGTCCDNFCGQCQGGSCVPVQPDVTGCRFPDGTPGTCCGGFCSDLTNDENNCGSCGNKCQEPTLICIGGYCTGGD